MPYAVTLPLDAGTAARVRRVWLALAEQVGTDDAIRLGYVPHVTLAVLPDSVPAPEIESALSGVVAGWTALSTVLAGLGIFPGALPVVWAAPVVTNALLARHAALCATLARFDVHPHYRPEHWVPHVTLSQAAPSLARAVEVATSAWEGPAVARFESIELVRFPPVTILWSHPLRPES